MAQTRGQFHTHPLPPAPLEVQHQQAQYPPPQQYPVPPQYNRGYQSHEQPQSQGQRPRSKSRSFSFRSDKSAKSGGNRPVNLQETSAEKEAHRLHSKADPTLAMNEAEPSPSSSAFAVMRRAYTFLC